MWRPAPAPAGLQQRVAELEEILKQKDQEIKDGPRVEPISGLAGASERTHQGAWLVKGGRSVFEAGIKLPTAVKKVRDCLLSEPFW